MVIVKWLSCLGILFGFGHGVAAMHKVPQIKHGWSQNVQSRLWRGIEKGQMQEVEAALNAGAWIDEENNEGYTPLTKALFLGYEVGVVAKGKRGNEIAVLLLIHKADVNKTKGGMTTPLMLVTRANNRPMVDQLLSSGASVDLSNTYQETALMMAVERGSFELVSELLAHSADPNKVDLEGRSVLMRVVKSGRMLHTPLHVSLVELLMRAGADLDAVDENGFTMERMPDASRGMANLVAQERTIRRALAREALREHAALQEHLSVKGLQEIVCDFVYGVFDPKINLAKERAERARYSMRQRQASSDKAIVQPVGAQYPCNSPKKRTLLAACVCSTSVD